MQEPLGEARAGCSSWAGRRLWEAPGPVDGVSQVNGDSHLAPAFAGLGLVRRGLNRGAVAPGSTFTSGESCSGASSPHLELCQLGSSHVSLELSELLPLHCGLSERVCALAF